MSVRGCPLYVEQDGAGPGFIWAHGLLGSVAQETETGLFGWPDAAEVTRLIRYDARGHGRSKPSRDANAQTWYELGADMLGLAATLEVDQPIVGGTSMGCATAIHAAIAAPEQVHALVLALPPTAWETRKRQQRAYRVSAPLIGLVGTKLLVGMSRITPKPKLFRGRLAEPMAAMTRHVGLNDRRSAEAALRGAAASDMPNRQAFARLEMPTLILSWEQDPTHPKSTAEELDRLIGDTELHHARTEQEILAWPSIVDSFLRRL